MTELTKLIADFDVNVAGSYATPVDITRKLAVEKKLAETTEGFETMMSGSVTATNVVSQQLLEEIKDKYTGIKPGTPIAEQKFTVPLTQHLSVQATVHPTARGGVPSEPGQAVEQKWLGITLNVNLTPSTQTVKARKDVITALRQG